MAQNSEKDNELSPGSRDIRTAEDLSAGNRTDPCPW